MYTWKSKVVREVYKRYMIVVIAKPISWTRSQAIDLVTVSRFLGPWWWLLEINTMVSNKGHGVFNHIYLDCLFKGLFKQTTLKLQISASLVASEVYPSVTNEFHSQWPAMWKALSSHAFIRIDPLPSGSILRTLVMSWDVQKTLEYSG